MLGASSWAADPVKKRLSQGRYHSSGMFVRMINDIEVHKIKPICYFTSYQKLSNNCKHSITILALYNHWIGSNHVQHDLVSNYYIYTYLYGIYTNYRPYVF